MFKNEKVKYFNFLKRKSKKNTFIHYVIKNNKIPYFYFITLKN